MSSLSDLMDRLSGDEAVEWDGPNAAVVALRLGDSHWIVGLRLGRLTEFSPWDVPEISMRRSDGLGMTGNDVRELPLGSLIEQARKLASGHPERRTDRIHSPSDVALSGFRPGARDRSDKDFAELALEYVFLLQDGNRHPARTLAEKYGGAPKTWANRLLEARSRGMLTSPGRGESGGSLTPEAEALLFPEAEDPT